MPGASVRLLKVSESQASKIASELGKKFEAYTSEIDEHVSELRSSPDDLTMAHVKFSNNLSAMKYCLQLLSLGSGVHGEYIMGNAGRDGRFLLSATPGTYLLQVSGEAEDRHAEWYQIVRIGWREQLRLVEPTCSYSKNE
jgi:exonuclease VII small subunit